MLGVLFWAAGFKFRPLSAGLRRMTKETRSFRRGVLAGLAHGSLQTTGRLAKSAGQAGLEIAGGFLKKMY